MLYHLVGNVQNNFDEISCSIMSEGSKAILLTFFINRILECVSSNLFVIAVTVSKLRP